VFSLHRQEYIREKAINDARRMFGHSSMPSPTTHTYTFPDIIAPYGYEQPSNGYQPLGSGRSELFERSVEDPAARSVPTSGSPVPGLAVRED
jgi:hypothetical protein